MVCLGSWGVFGEFFLPSAPYKSIRGFIDADSTFLPSSPHFLLLEYVCGFSVALAAPVCPLLLTLHRPDVSKQVTTIAPAQASLLNMN